jgi:hypothetical protein
MDRPAGDRDRLADAYLPALAVDFEDEPARQHFGLVRCVGCVCGGSRSTAPAGFVLSIRRRPSFISTNVIRCPVRELTISCPW